MIAPYEGADRVRGRGRKGGGRREKRGAPLQKGDKGAGEAYPPVHPLPYCL